MCFSSLAIYCCKPIGNAIRKVRAFWIMDARHVATCDCCFFRSSSHHHQIRSIASYRYCRFAADGLYTIDCLVLIPRRADGSSMAGNRTDACWIISGEVTIQRCREQTLNLSARWARMGRVGLNGLRLRSLLRGLPVFCEPENDLLTQNQHFLLKTRSVSLVVASFGSIDMPSHTLEPINRDRQTDRQTDRQHKRF